MSALVAEKLDQAIGILKELEIDCWLTFVRETMGAADPVLPLILGQHLTWQSALILTREGDRVAIVGNYDADAVRTVSGWTDVVPYVHGIRDPLVETLDLIKPRSIAINYSPDDVKADGLSHGMFLLLQDYLEGTPHARRLRPADDVVSALRGRKTPGEVERIRRAIATTGEIFCQLAGFARPGHTEIEVARHAQDLARQRGVELGWDARGCPIVNSGPNSMIGHGIPSNIRIEPGHLFHIDFGIVQDDYCSDLQRMWYVPREGESEAPEPVRRAFETVAEAIRAAAAVLDPGVEGWTVDAAARQVVIDAGYPEYLHGTGHQVGRHVHDGGAVLGPRWERYGRTPYRKVEAGNVYTLELGIENVNGAGYLGLEEMVLVTDSGCEFLSTPQKELLLLR